MHWIRLYLPCNHSFKQNSQVLLYPVVLLHVSCLYPIPSISVHYVPNKHSDLDNSSICLNSFYYNSQETVK